MHPHHGPQCHIFTFLEHFQGPLLHYLPGITTRKRNVSNLNLPLCNLKPLPVVLSLLPGRSSGLPPHRNILSGRCREHWGLSESPAQQIIPVPWAAPHKTCALDPSQLRCPSLDMLWGLSVFLAVSGPKLNPVLENVLKTVTKMVRLLAFFKWLCRLSSTDERFCFVLFLQLTLDVLTNKLS